MQKIDNPHIVLCGGGSGGHLTPLLAVSQELLRQQPAARLSYIGDSRDKMPADLLKDTDIKLSLVPSGKIRRYKGLGILSKIKLWRHYSKNILDMFRLVLGTMKSAYLLARDRPDIVFSKGGYPALPVCLAAVVLRIPIVTHDSDAVPGLSHRIVRRFVKRRLVGVASKAPDTVHVGVPVRAEFYNEGAVSYDILQNYNIKNNDQYILATGGGLGATRLNIAVLDAFAALSSAGNLHLVLLAGTKDYEPVVQEVNARDLSELVEVRAFSSDMPVLLRAANILITRAGATSIAEAAAAGAASIILPNGSLPGQHQTHNAQAFMDAEAAVVIPSSSNKIDHQLLTVKLQKLIMDKDLQAKLKKNIRTLAKADAASQTAAIILEEAGAA